MINEVVHPDSIDGFQHHVVRANAENKQLTIVGGQSKVRVSVSTPQQVISTTKYSGVVAHQASDFTITVRAGTPVKVVLDLLGSVGQHLPFDPAFVDKGASVGGLIGSGLNGPCRLRFGGLRDFVIGCQFMDGRGRVVRAGGKVVKNAAGFDLPKFLIGSAGKFGLLLEITFKVFPKPRFSQSVIFETESTNAALEMLQRLISCKMDFNGLEILENNHVLARWSTEAETTPDLRQPFDLLATKIKSHRLVGPAEHQCWSDLANFNSLKPTDVVIKVPLIRNSILSLDRDLNDLKIARRFGAAGNVAILFLDSSNKTGEVSSRLTNLGLAGQVIVGQSDQFLIGALPQMPFLKRVKSALDPDNRFGPLEHEHSMEAAR